MIYFVEDDRNIRDLVVYTLDSTGFDARGCADATQLWTHIAQALPDLILLDVMLPGTDGMSILKRLKAKAATRFIPVIMVTAKDAEYNKVAALDLGADDYVTKPFGMMELVSRVRAVLRRSAPLLNEAQAGLNVGLISLDVLAHSAKVADHPLDLTLKEFELLEELMRNENILLSRDHLLDTVWGYSFHGATRTVDVHIRTLRKKLADVDADAASYIQTVRGVGYKLSASSTLATSTRATPDGLAR
ncbi:MAG: response regulator transcription factor [Actinomycetaceae bacterium]|nr:response regulator transcription factor [Actinomycetaceae bacterium]MDY5855019.1 response regulator transcription factor [Arcanobacterium sp.]